MTNPRPSVAAAPVWNFPSCRCTTLDNGLDVQVYNMPGQYVVSATLALNLPLTAEGTDEGIAQITARCLDEGTPRFPGTAFTEAIEAQGAKVGVSVSSAGTHILLDVPGSRLTSAMHLFAEMVTSPTLTADDVERHVALRIAELDQTYANSSLRATTEFRKAIIDPRSRYSRPPGGERSTVERIIPAAVARFHQQFYGPKIGTLIIAGDFADDPLDAVESAFGSWENPVQQSAIDTVPERTPTSLLIDRPGSVQADVRFGNLTITRTDPDWANMLVACYAMGGAFLSRLNQELREKRGYTYGVSMGIAPMRSAGIGTIQGSFRPDTVANALTVTKDYLDIEMHPFSQDEVENAVNYITGVTPLRFASAAGVVDQLATLANCGLGARFINQNLDNLRSVTPDSATAAAARLLQPDNMSLVVVGPADVLASQLENYGWKVRIQ